MNHTAEYKVACNGIVLKEEKDNPHYLELEYRDNLGERNVNNLLMPFANSVYKLTDRLEDLLEIAGYIFAADRKTYRGRDDDVEYHRWSRSFYFHINVRDYNFWNKTEVKRLLSEALCFMTGDTGYDFTFYQAEPDFPINLFDNDNFELNPEKNPNVILFSGGLDSLAGVIEKLASTDNEICLVSHQSGHPVIKSIQNKLYEEINSKYDKRCKHYKFHCGLKNTTGIDETQRSRPLLYCATAFAIAKTYKQKCIYIYENGVTSMNFARTQDLMNGRASRTTHPKTIGILQKLFSLIAEEEFKIEHPFLNKTKTDVLNVLKENDGIKLFDSAISCNTSRKRPAGFRQCGICSQCIDRIFASYAAEVEKYDDTGLYHFYFLKEPIEDDDIYKVLVDYLKQAQDFCEENMTEFFINRANELVEIEPYIEGKSEEDKIETLYNLCKRHAKQIEFAIERMRNIYDKPLSRIHKNSFFKRILEPREYQKSERELKKEKTDETTKSLKVIQGNDNQQKIKKILEEKIKGYLQTCKFYSVEEPTIEQLSNITEISKPVWQKELNKSSFWHLLKEKAVNSIHQAKKQEKKDFWINVKLYAENKYADLTMKEIRGKEKFIDDLPKKKRSSF